MGVAITLDDLREMFEYLLEAAELYITAFSKDFDTIRQQNLALMHMAYQRDFLNYSVGLRILHLFLEMDYLYEGLKKIEEQGNQKT